MSEFSVKIIFDPAWIRTAGSTTKLGTPCKPKESNLNGQPPMLAGYKPSEVAGSRIFFMFPVAGRSWILSPEKCEPKKTAKKKRRWFDGFCMVLSFKNPNKIRTTKKRKKEILSASGSSLPLYNFFDHDAGNQLEKLILLMTT